MNLEDPKITEAGEKFAKILNEIEGKLELPMVSTPIGEIPHPSAFMELLMILKMRVAQTFMRVTFLDAVVSALVNDVEDPEEYIAKILNEQANNLTALKKQAESKIVLPKQDHNIAVPGFQK